MTRTYEELLAAQTELAHFNPFHNPKNGQFAKKNGGISSNKEYDRWRTEQDRLDEEWDRLKKERKSLGKNIFSRTIAVSKGSSEAAKKYSKDFDKWSTEQDKNDARKMRLEKGSSAKEKDIMKKAKRAAVAAAAIAGGVTLGKALNDQRIFNKAGLGDKINPIARTYEGITKAGKASTMAALAVIGGYTVKDYVTKQPKSERIRPRKALGMAIKSAKKSNNAATTASLLVTAALGVYGYRKVKDLMKNKYVEGGLPYYG